MVANICRTARLLLQQSFSLDPLLLLLPGEVDVAGHRAIAEMIRFADHSDEPELERIEAERRAEERRRARGDATYA